MKIRSIKIEKLYGKYDFEWSLDEDINILAGDNGAFKTTLLRIIAAMCEPDSINDLYPLKSVTAEMTNGIQVKYRSFQDSLLRLKKDAENDELLYELASKVSADLKSQDEKGLADHTLNASIIAIKKNNAKISVGSYKKERKYNYIATFDVVAKADKGSVLDQQLEKLESEYAFYLSDLSKQLSNRIMKSGTIDKCELQKIYAQNSLFVDIVNEAFANTNKTVDSTQSKLQFKIGDELLEDNRKLSSGEKQFLIICITLLLQREEESILILDEPEISMHLDWQRNLLANIRRMNPKCQVILATHSPGVIMDGWEQLVQNISDLSNPTE